MTDGGTAQPSGPLLPTKLFIPVPEPDVVIRRRLLTAFDDARRARVVLVAAPAGSGKTTLVADWVRHCAEPVGWVSLDVGDDDPATFIKYVVDALASLGPTVCPRTRALMASGAAPEPQLVAQALLAELAATGAAAVVVLDDYHVIAAPAIHGLLTLLIERSPAAVRFVVISRNDPPLPLARMRARAQLAEVREADLRFDLDEATELTGRLSRRTLSRDAVVALTQRTEGWAVGLQLAALALRQAANPDDFVTEFTGTHAFVADYLTDEVLAAIPVEQQRFLVETAPLRRLTGALCDAALGRTGSAELLEALHRANLFLVPLDAERRWFRYHHLFADLLRRRWLDAGGGDDAQRALLARAVDWCERTGALDDAMAYALQAGDPARAADIVARHGVSLLASGQGVTALRWIGLLPDEVVQASPDHCVIAAWALTLMQVYDQEGGASDVEVERKGAPLTPTAHDPIGGYARRALEMLEEGRRAYPYVDDVEQHARVLLATADAAEGPVAALRALEAARDATPETNQPLRAAAELRIGELCSLSGDYATGLAAHERARDFAVMAGAELLRVSATTGRAWILLLEGRLRELIATVAAELSDRPTARESLGTYAGNLHAFAAAAHLERNELDSARSSLARAWAAFGATGDSADAWRGIVRFGRARPRASHLTVHAVLWGFVTQLRLLIVGGESASALRHLDALAASLPHAAGAMDRAVLDSLRVLALTRTGDRGSLRQWLQRTPVGPVGSRYWDGAVQLTRARAALAIDDVAEASRALAPLVAAASPGAGDLLEVEALVLSVAATPAVGASGREAVLQLTERALEVTAENGRVAPWLDLGALAIEPLEAAVRAGRGSTEALAHAAAVLGAVQQDLSIVGARGPGELSDRELTVLRLLAAGHTNQQIAEALFLAVGSVKKHTHNIFAKLGVANRTQAAQVARDRGLLR
jgi:LuxR family transcriptional regulator, maltose regulon positive regulatory protein